MEGENFLTQPEKAELLHSKAPPCRLQLAALQQAAAAHCKKSGCANTTCLSVRFSLVVCFNNIQSYTWSEQGHSPLHSGIFHQCRSRRRRFPCSPTCVALCRCFLWARSEQSAAFAVQRSLSTFTSHVELDLSALNIKHTCNLFLATVHQIIYLPSQYNREQQRWMMPELLFLHLGISSYCYFLKAKAE